MTLHNAMSYTFALFGYCEKNVVDASTTLNINSEPLQKLSEENY